MRRKQWLMIILLFQVVPKKAQIMDFSAPPQKPHLKISKLVASSAPNLTASSQKEEGKEERFVLFNLCGKRFQLDCFQILKSNRKSLLMNFASSSPSDRKKLAEFYTEETKTYYFWRNPLFFEYILQYHRKNGTIHCPPLICPDLFMEELKFWDINLDFVSDCCRPKLGLPPVNLTPNCENHSESQEEENPMIQNGTTNLVLKVPTKGLMESDSADDFSSVFCGKRRRKLWAVLEKPGSSRTAKIFTMFSVGLIIISVFALILGSMREFQDEGGEPIKAIVYTEYSCVIWFSFEYFCRLLVTANKLDFMKDILNIVDALAIFPFYVEFCLIATGSVINDNLQNVKGALLAMRILRVLRVARVFKLARYSVGLQSFMRTFASSHKELGMLMMFFSSSVLLFSTTVYFMEKDAEKSPFISIPATFWWAIVTMTTVGYGDMIPVTIGGKLVASFATITGVIVLAFPITMIVENFCNYYEHHTNVRPSGSGGRRSSVTQAHKKLHIKGSALI